MQLRKIAEIALGEERFDLARNGDGFYLVKNEEEDAYGHPVARLVTIQELVPTMREGVEVGLELGLTAIGRDRIVALIDLIGDLTSRLQGKGDLLIAAGGGGGE